MSSFIWVVQICTRSSHPPNSILKDTFQHNQNLVTKENMYLVQEEVVFCGEFRGDSNSEKS